MKHILLTGATGFLGSHLLVALLKQGYKVTILKRTTSNTYRIKDLMPKLSVVDVDLLPLEEAFKWVKVDLVIHTACCYCRGGQAIDELVESNILFGLRLLNAAIFFKTSTFINTDTMLPKYLNSYSITKKHFAEWLKLFIGQIKIVNLKLEHIYGPMDDTNKFVPWVISQFDKNVSRVPLTEGEQLRDFIYIDDVISAYLTVTNKIESLPEFSEFDVVTGNLVSVRDFIIALHSAYKKIHPNNNTELGFGDISMRNGEITRVIADAVGLRRLGWINRFTLTQGISKLYGDKI